MFVRERPIGWNARAHAASSAPQTRAYVRTPGMMTFPVFGGRPHAPEKFASVLRQPGCQVHRHTHFPMVWICTPDPWLCVPALRRVCIFRDEGLPPHQATGKCMARRRHAAVSDFARD